MIASAIQEEQIEQYGLGGHDPPKDVLDALQEMDKNLLLIWNVDQWEIYRRYKGLLHWQKSCPVKGLTITPGVKAWLQKYDTSCGGRWDVDDRKKQFLEGMYEGLAHEAKVKSKSVDESMIEISSLNQFMARNICGGSGPISVPEGPVVGYNNGVPIRAYKKDSPFSKTLFRGRF